MSSSIFDSGWPVFSAIVPELVPKAQLPAALALNGVLSSLAGAYLVLAQNPSFIPNMTAGRGYMALAALIFVTIPGSTREPLMLLLGSLGTMAGGVVNYYFGSSAGSARKDEIMAQQGVR